MSQSQKPPDLSQQALADYWIVYEDNFEPLQVLLMEVALTIPVFKEMVTLMDPVDQQKRSQQSFLLQRGAVMDGDWEPYAQDLRDQGRTYAAMGVEFSAWYEIVRPFRRQLAPLILDRYADDAPRRRAALEAMNEVMDYAMGELAIAYIEAERDQHAAARRALEAAVADNERRNVDLQEFAYVASHDMQEPLRQISAFSQMLERSLKGKLEVKEASALAYVMDGAERMRTLISDLLSYSRTEHVEITMAPVPLPALVDQALADLGSVIEQAGATIEAHDLPTVHGDTTLLARVLLNLLSNAVKFRDKERAPLIKVTASHDARGSVITVADNGLGIPQEQEARVFQVFQRLHPRAYAGNGVGLAICRKIIDRHGGKIWYEPNEPHGTRFSFLLPRAVEP